jgi:hypothetical protein
MVFFLKQRPGQEHTAYIRGSNKEVGGEQGREQEAWENLAGEGGQEEVGRTLGRNRETGGGKGDRREVLGDRRTLRIQGTAQKKLRLKKLISRRKDSKGGSGPLKEGGFLYKTLGRGLSREQVAGKRTNKGSQGAPRRALNKGLTKNKEAKRWLSPGRPEGGICSLEGGLLRALGQEDGRGRKRTSLSLERERGKRRRGKRTMYTPTWCENTNHYCTRRCSHLFWAFCGPGPEDST